MQKQLNIYIMAAIVAAVQCAAQIDEETELRGRSYSSSGHGGSMPWWVAVPLLICFAGAAIFGKSDHHVEEVHHDDHYVAVEEHHSDRSC